MRKLSKREEILHSANVTLVEIFTNSDKIPITDGLLMMSMYMQFVFPKEANIIIDFEAYNLDLNIFKVIKWEETKTDLAESNIKAMVRRIRNSIAHARVDFCSNGMIEFYDGVAKNKGFKENFRIKVKKTDFGNKFLKEIMQKWMESKI